MADNFEVLGAHNNKDVYYVHNFPVEPSLDKNYRPIKNEQTGEQDEFIDLLVDASLQAGVLDKAVYAAIENPVVAAAYDANSSSLVAMFIAEERALEKEFDVRFAYTNSRHPGTADILHYLWVDGVITDYINDIGVPPVARINFGDDVDIATERMLALLGVREEGAWNIILPNFIGITDPENMIHFEKMLPEIVGSDEESGLTEDDNLIACIEQIGQMTHRYYHGADFLASHTVAVDGKWEYMIGANGTELTVPSPATVPGSDMEKMFRCLHVRRFLGLTVAQWGLIRGNLV